MVFCKFIFVYKLGRPKMGARVLFGIRTWVGTSAWAGTKVLIHKTISIKMKILLLLVKALRVFLASPFLLMREKL